MVLDILFLGFLLIFIIKGFKKGLLFTIFSTIAILIGALAALKFSNIVAQHLFLDTNGTMARWAPFVSYILVFLLVSWLVKILGHFIQKSLSILLLGWVNKLAGALLYGIMVCVAGSLIFWLLGNMNVMNTKTTEQSKIYPVIYPFAPYIIENVMPFADELLGDLQQYYNDLKQEQDVVVD